MILAINIVLILFIIACAIATVHVKELVSAVFILSCYSFFYAILFSLLNAADVSFTEAMVGAGASTIFCLLALFETKHWAKGPVFAFNRGLAAAVTLCLGALLVWGSSDLPAFGIADSVPSLYLSPYYLLHTLHDMDTPNAVTSVLADYRSFDTLLETAVIFTAGISCLLIVRSSHD